MPSFGYAGRTLRVDLSSAQTGTVPTQDYTGRFLGGRGIAAKVYWDEVPPGISALDAENRLIFATGPLAGVPTIGGSRWQVCGKSPSTTPEHFSYCNLGGRWGASLKFAGYDAIIVHGRSEKPVYLLIHEDGTDFKDASALWGKGAIETREILKRDLGQSARVVAIGPAGENMAVMATLLADNDASGSAGLGAVMGSKKLKAIVVLDGKKGTEVAYPERLRELIRYYRGLRRITLVSSSYRFSTQLVPSLGHTKMKRMDPCYGCRGCTRRLYEADNGRKGKYFCAAAMFYQPWAVAYHGGWNDVAFHATKLIDDYGLDSKTIDRMIGWLHACYKAGILTDESAGIPISRTGSLEFMETLVKKVAFREGFGDMLARGINAAAESIGPGAVEQTKRIGYIGMPQYEDIYSPRLYITNALFYAMEPRIPIHQLHEVGALIPRWVSWVKQAPGATASSEVIRAIARRFWGSEVAGDFSTYEGKAMASKKIQERQVAKECLILCDWIWPITDLESSADHVGDPTLESKLLSAVTGQDVDEEGLYRIAERVFNLQRAILVREGHRGRDFDELPSRCFTEPLKFDFMNPDCLVPGKDGEVVSRKGAVIDRQAFERMKDEYYQLRRWDVKTGLQTGATLGELGLPEVSEDLERRGLLGRGD